MPTSIIGGLEWYGSGIDGGDADNPITVDSSTYDLDDPDSTDASLQIITNAVQRRDFNPSYLTINDGVTYDTSGYMIQCPGVLAIYGTLMVAGTDASGALGGASAHVGSCNVSSPGQDGGTSGKQPTTFGYGGKGGKGGGAGATSYPPFTKSGAGPSDPLYFLTERPFMGGGGGGTAPGLSSQTTGAKFPTTNATYSGTGFTNPNNAHADDATYATAAVASGTTKGQKYGTFGFGAAIPTGATITSVSVSYEYKVSTTAQVATSRMKARIGGTDQANHDNTAEPTTDTVVTVDITADRSWSRADLLDGTLEIVLEASNTTGTDVTFSYDYVKVTVGYNINAAGSGAGGGVIALYAHTIAVGQNGLISAKGTNGANGIGANGGGGGGGGGGFVIVKTERFLLHPDFGGDLTLIFDVTGGLGGTGTGTEPAGDPGQDGRVFLASSSPFVIDDLPV